MTDEIPERLRRDKNNKAPFMLPPVRDLTEQMFEDALVEFRTQNNKAPFMEAAPAGHWFDPFTRTWSDPPTKPPAGKLFVDPVTKFVTFTPDAVNPSDSPQETSQDWVPPWGLK